jgi:hypothetical protein
VVLVVAAVSVGGVVAWATGGAVDRAATVSSRADRVSEPVSDVAVAWDTGDVDRSLVDAVNVAMAEIGGVATPSRSGSIGLRRLARSGVTVHAPPAGYLIPITFVSLPRGAIAPVIGGDVSAVVDDTTVVLNEITADLMGAVEGDTLDLRADNGSTVTVTIGGVQPNAELGGSELVFTTAVADRLGMTGDTRVVMWGFDDRSALDTALARQGVLTRINTKVARSWDPFDPDDTISTARTKVALGEPWYRVNGDGSISMHPTWVATNLTDGRVLLNDTVRIRAQCHVVVVGDLAAALADVVTAGLASTIDVGDTNAYGGCFNPRYSRNSGYLSRHSYGMAIDINTDSNCLGCRPPMNCEVVRIFRRHGFAWGGNFRVPDGMHFEWVGEPRDQVAYPSKYCPNIVQPLAEASPPPVLGSRVLTAGDPGAAHDHAVAP